MDKEAELKKLGEIIRNARKARNMTQLQLAHAIGKDQQSIQRLEAGGMNPTFIYLSEVSDGLNIPLKELFNES